MNNERNKKTQPSSARATQERLVVNEAPIIEPQEKRDNSLLIGGLLGGSAVIAAGAVVFGLSKNNEASDAKATSDFLKSRTPQVLQVNGVVTATPNLQETNDYLVSLLSATPKLETKVAVKQTNPTAVPTETLTLVPNKEENYNSNQIYPGEATFNDLLATTHSSNELMNKVKEHLKANFARKDRVDSTATSLFNDFNKPFNIDPIKEGGLGQTLEDIDGYRSIADVLNSPIAVDATTHINANGLITAGVYGNANDRDAMAAYLAAAIANYKNPNQFADTLTAQDALKNQQTAAVIAPWQMAIFARIQEQFLGVSGQESKRRNTNDNNDMSNKLNNSLKKQDQWLSRDVYRSLNDARADQIQNTRCVVHKSQEVYTFTRANSEAENDLMVLAIDPNTGVWKAKAFTFRSYHGNENTTLDIAQNQINSSVGEEMLPGCGPAVVVAPKKPEAKQPVVNAQVSVPQGGPGPGSAPTTPPNYPTPAPTNVHEFTPAPTQQPPTPDIKPTDAP